MGLDYSYILIIRKELLDGLLGELARHLTSGDNERLRSALPWRPARPVTSDRSRWKNPDDSPWATDEGILGLIGDGKEVEYQHFCLSLMFPVDSNLRDYVGGYQPPDLGTKAQVGCVWTCLTVDDRYAKIEFTAATSDMSRLFESSGAVRDTFRHIAVQSGASCLLFDREDEERWDLIVPEEREVRVGAQGIGNVRDAPALILRQASVAEPQTDG